MDRVWCEAPESFFQSRSPIQYHGDGRGGPPGRWHVDQKPLTVCCDAVMFESAADETNEHCLKQCLRYACLKSAIGLYLFSHKVAISGEIE